MSAHQQGTELGKDPRRPPLNLPLQLVRNFSTALAGDQIGVPAQRWSPPRSDNVEPTRSSNRRTFPSTSPPMHSASPVAFPFPSLFISFFHKRQDSTLHLQVPGFKEQISNPKSPSKNPSFFTSSVQCSASPGGWISLWPCRGNACFAQKVVLLWYFVLGSLCYGICSVVYDLRDLKMCKNVYFTTPSPIC